MTDFTYRMPEELVTFITPNNFNFYAHKQPSVGAVEDWRMVVTNETNEGRGMFYTFYDQIAVGQPLFVSANMRVKLESGGAELVALWFNDGNVMTVDPYVKRIEGNHDYGQGFDFELIVPPYATNLRFDFRAWNCQGIVEFWGLTIWPGVPVVASNGETDG